MELSPKEQAKKLTEQYRPFCSWGHFEEELDLMHNVKLCAKLDIQGKIDLLSELNKTKLCKFDKEIDYWNEVLKELDSL